MIMAEVLGAKPHVHFEVEKVIGVSSDGNVRSYQVQWAPAWVSVFQLVGCEHLIQEFLLQQSTKEELKHQGTVELPVSSTNSSNEMELIENCADSPPDSSCMEVTMDESEVARYLEPLRCMAEGNSAFCRATVEKHGNSRNTDDANSTRNDMNDTYDFNDSLLNVTTSSNELENYSDYSSQDEDADNSSNIDQNATNIEEITSTYKKNMDSNENNSINHNCSDDIRKDISTSNSDFNDNNDNIITKDKDNNCNDNTSNTDRNSVNYCNLWRNHKNNMDSNDNQYDENSSGNCSNNIEKDIISSNRDCNHNNDSIITTEDKDNDCYDNTSNMGHNSVNFGNLTSSYEKNMDSDDNNSNSNSNSNSNDSNSSDNFEKEINTNMRCCNGNNNISIPKDNQNNDYNNIIYSRNDEKTCSTRITVSTDDNNNIGNCHIRDNDNGNSLCDYQMFREESRRNEFITNNNNNRIEKIHANEDNDESRNIDNQVICVNSRNRNSGDDTGCTDFDDINLDNRNSGASAIQGKQQVFNGIPFETPIPLIILPRSIPNGNTNDLHFTEERNGLPFDVPDIQIKLEDSENVSYSNHRNSFNNSTYENIEFQLEFEEVVKVKQETDVENFNPNIGEENSHHNSESITDTSSDPDVNLSQREIYPLVNVENLKELFVFSQSKECCLKKIVTMKSKLKNKPKPKLSSKTVSRLDSTKHRAPRSVQHLNSYVKCQHCGRTLLGRYLSRHLRSHLPEKPHRCEYCDKAFKRKDALFDHVRAVHTKDKPFKCTKCDKSFLRNCALQLHMETHAKQALKAKAEKGSIKEQRTKGRAGV